MKIRSGATRIIFVFKSFVLKIPRLQSWKGFLVGLLANLQERTFSKTNWIELCPVYFADPLGLLVVMPYAEPLGDRAWAEFDFQEFAVKEDYSIPVENKRNSFGIWRDRLVAIDYGT